MEEAELGVCTYVRKWRNLRCALRLIFQGCTICVAYLQSNLRFRNLRFKKPRKQF